MRAVHHKVNIVPVIAKADTLTKGEVLRLKRRVSRVFVVSLQDSVSDMHKLLGLYKYSVYTCDDVSGLCCQVLEQNAAPGTEIYTLPECDEDEDEDYKEQCRQLKVSTDLEMSLK